MVDSIFLLLNLAHCFQFTFTSFNGDFILFKLFYCFAQFIFKFFDLGIQFDSNFRIASYN